MPSASSHAFVVAVLLAALQVANAAAVASNTAWNDPLVITTYETQEATSTDVDNVKFVKYATVDSLADAKAVSKLFLSLPGRAFIDYIDYQDGGELVNSSTLMQVKISGDVFDLVDQVRIWSEDDTEEVTLEMFTSAYLNQPSAPGHLLVEVSVFRANSIRGIQATSSDGRSLEDGRALEVVINDGVVYSRDDSPQTSDSGVFEPTNDTLDIASTGATSLYLLTTSTQLNLYELSVVVMDQSNVYIDGGALATSYDVSAIVNPDTSFIAFFDSVQTDKLRLSADGGGTICFSVSDSLETGSNNYVPDPASVALPGQTGGVDVTGSFTYSKVQIPDREPRDISLKVANFTPSDGSASSGNGPATGSDASTAPSQDNDGSSLQSVGVLGAVASVVVGLTML